ncbi:VWA domain-containing protein [Chitinimonas lacunae]|uniref:VWA domain-containing protein n=1 Tax=Chitinimonas lacunae TaxID=1963018 RepID=A0ABV8MP26_9NEIS
MAELDEQTRRRWRLVLGADAEAGAPHSALDHQLDRARDAALGFLYEREFDQREDEQASSAGRGIPDPRAVSWLAEVRRLFPQSACEILQREALQRYGLHELLRDPELLAQATPSMELAKALIALMPELPPAGLSAARRLIAQVVADIEQRLATPLRASCTERRQRRHGGRPRLSDLDWHRTLARNLRHFQPELGTVVPERLLFFRRRQSGLPWRIVLLVDQSGSMLDSLIHASCVAAILARVRSLRTHLVAFSDQPVDLTAWLPDSVETLLHTQLGGGTRIGAALAYAERLVEQPQRTVVVLISDFYEGYNEAEVLVAADRLLRSGVHLLGLATLDERSHPNYDRDMASRLTALGMEVAAMTPDRLAQWLGRILGSGQ